MPEAGPNVLLRGPRRRYRPDFADVAPFSPPRAPVYRAMPAPLVHVLLAALLPLPDGRALEVDVQCDPAATIVYEDIAYAPCGIGGVVVVGLTNEPRFIARIQFPGSVTGVHVSGGTIWAETTRVEAYPIPRDEVDMRAVAVPEPKVWSHAPETVPAPLVPTPRRSRMFVPRQGGLASLALHARPLLPTGTLGVGVIAQAAASYHFEHPIEVGVLLEPLAGALTNDQNAGTLGATAFVQFDHELVGIGLGLGATDVTRVDYTGVGNIDQQDAAFSVTLLARLGTRDGLNISARNSYIAIDDALEYNGTIGRLQLPVSDHAAIFGQGGALQGFAFGELGVRLRVHGDGGHDTLFVDASAGGGAVFFRNYVTCGDFTCVSRDSHAGPLVGIGVEYRP
jgi:hypothetical protein